MAAPSATEKYTVANAISGFQSILARLSGAERQQFCREVEEIISEAGSNKYDGSLSPNKAK